MHCFFCASFFVLFGALLTFATALSIIFVTHFITILLLNEYKRFETPVLPAVPMLRFCSVLYYLTTQNRFARSERFVFSHFFYSFANDLSTYGLQYFVCRICYQVCCFCCDHLWVGIKLNSVGSFIYFNCPLSVILLLFVEPLIAVFFIFLLKTFYCVVFVMHIACALFYEVYFHLFVVYYHYNYLAMLKLLFIEFING